MWERGWSRAGVVVVAICGALILPAAAGAATPPYLAGAARVDTTPPPFDAAADAAAFPSCPSTVFSGPRVFGLQEPYVDTDNNGRFSYQGVGQDAVPEPYCDANLNGRYDGIYDSGGVDQIASEAHDPIDARAFAIDDGTHNVVIVSVVAQGLFENYTEAIRQRVAQLRPGIDDVIVSANHNESSPDTIGIYGGPAVQGAFGANSGIDAYYIDFLVERVARAAVDAYDNRVPADLRVSEYGLPSNVRVRLSKNFPTTDDNGDAAAIDPKVRVLSATDAAGSQIFTVMNLAAHNQEIGHSSALAGQLSSDWPGYFHDRLEQLAGGKAIFLVADNGSEEDPETVPPVDQTANPECSDGCYAQAEATGDALAQAVFDHLPDAEPLRGGSITVRRDQFFVPLENTLFKGAAAAGLFGDRETYLDGQPVGKAGDQVRTETDVISVGPDLQLATNPGEAFPALILGSPWGIEDVGCPERPNPPVPAWHLSATHRFQVGLANDLIGYEIPAWAYSSTPGTFTYNGAPNFGTAATCVNDPNTDKDSKGHQHKLETEGAGPTASNLVAEHLTALADQDPDPIAKIRAGRFIYADGSLSRRATRPTAGGGSEDAVGIWLADPGSSTLAPGTGKIVALPGIAAFGDRYVDLDGRFMDYDGQAQGDPGITTRGMVAPAPERVATPSDRFYVDVYPALGGGSLGPSAPTLGTCDDNEPPSSRIDAQRFRLQKHKLRIAGTAVDGGCNVVGQKSRPGSIRSITLEVAKRVGHGRCRFVFRNGRLGHKARSCKRAVRLRPKGRADWQLSLKLRKRLPKGRYVARARARDAEGNREPRPSGSDANVIFFRVN
ncbi:MAG: hypothetical protein ACR2MB_11505 [Acidimicrobiales bacterium]